MLLRNRQKTFVERSVSALKDKGNTLGVAPTGSGKTIMLSAVIGHLLVPDQKACVLAHRDELTQQNESKFKRVNPSISTSVFDAQQKSWRGQTTFAMVPTLARQNHLNTMPEMDLLVIDEAHHAVADTYRRIIDHAQDINPDCKIYGVTATAVRGDKKGLREVFSNVADQVRLGELIRSGHLVPPRTFVIDVGAQEELKKIKRGIDDFDMNAVEEIMDTVPITEAVIKHWKAKAADRKTVVFCSTVNHAQHVCDAFNAANVPTVMVHGGMSKSERKSQIKEFESGDAQVIVNVAVLVEGYDYTPIGCVILLRPSSYKSTLIQMVGRGLRTVDPNEYPGVVKSDCIVLDFGISTLLHGTLEQDADLDAEPEGEAPTKICPECAAEVPIATMECPLCGYIWEHEEMGGGDEKTPLTDFVMSEVDLFKRSNFLWIDLFNQDDALMATGFNAWSGIFFLNGQWYAIGADKQIPIHLLAIGERTICLAAADDWLNDNETADSAHKSQSWLSQPATEKQLHYLPSNYQMDYGLTRYKASVLLAFQFNKSAIKKLIFEVDERKKAA